MSHERLASRIGSVVAVAAVSLLLQDCNCGGPAAGGSFTVSGTVTGLVGTGLVLQDNGGDDVAVGANGAFSFPTKVADGAPYAVTVRTQPASPTQVCTVANGSGTVAGADVADVSVTCVTSTFTVGGTVTGLLGSGLVLQNNGADDLTIDADGSFTFATPVPSGSGFTVTVLAQPSSPTQTCVVSGGSGAVGSGHVTSVVVNCATDAFTVGGQVSGLVGTVVLQNNGGDDLTLTANGAFAFPTTLASGTAYAVTVLTQPASPVQVCTVANGSGTVGGANVTDVTVTCVTSTFTIGGTVTGLAGTGLVLQDNGGDDLAVSADGAFTFATRLTVGAAYAVTVLTQPSGPSQTCVVSAGTGTVATADVTSVVVTCTTNQYLVGGTVTGLAAGESVVLQNNGADDLTVGADGTFTFATAIDSGAAYAVTVLTHPAAPIAQTCAVSAGTGTVGGADVTTVTVTCTTNTYLVGGTVTGLAGAGLVLRNDGGDDLTITADGAFAFSTPVASGAAYAVTVFAQPTSPWQTCAVTSGSGTVTNAAITSVAVACTTNSYAVGGTVSGLAAGASVVLRNDGADDLAVSANGSFTFATGVLSGAAYAVTVFTNPTSPIAQTCTVTSGSGVVGGADVTDVAVACSTNSYTVGGVVSGLTGTGLVLRNNGGDDLSVSANGAFSFSAPVLSGATYAVTVFTQPSSPSQLCFVSGGTGTVGAGNVTSVSVTCSTSDGTVRDISGGLHPIWYVPCGNGTNANCSEAVAKASCTASGRRLVSQFGAGAQVFSLGATGSCNGWSIGYFTNVNPAFAGQCLIGMGCVDSTYCCNTAQWYGNTVNIPTTLGEQFGFIYTTDLGYSATMNNVSGTTWGCYSEGTAPTARAGCGTVYVACAQ